LLRAIGEVCSMSEDAVRKSESADAPFSASELGEQRKLKPGEYYKIDKKTGQFSITPVKGEGATITQIFKEVEKAIASEKVPTVNLKDLKEHCTELFLKAGAPLSKTETFIQKLKAFFYSLKFGAAFDAYEKLEKSIKAAETGDTLLAKQHEELVKNALYAINNRREIREIRDKIQELGGGVIERHIVYSDMTIKDSEMTIKVKRDKTGLFTGTITTAKGVEQLTGEEAAQLHSGIVKKEALARIPRLVQRIPRLQEEIANAYREDPRTIEITRLNAGNKKIDKCKFTFSVYEIEVQNERGKITGIVRLPGTSTIIQLKKEDATKLFDLFIVDEAQKKEKELSRIPPTPEKMVIDSTITQLSTFITQQFSTFSAAKAEALKKLAQSQKPNFELTIPPSRTTISFWGDKAGQHCTITPYKKKAIKLDTATTLKIQNLISPDVSKIKEQVLTKIETQGLKASDSNPIFQVRTDDERIWGIYQTGEGPYNEEFDPANPSYKLIQLDEKGQETREALGKKPPHVYQFDLRDSIKIDKLMREQ
jgi:hypothetical protein